MAPKSQISPQPLGTDAVNLNQLNQAMRVTNENIKELRDEARADVASAVALGGII